MSDDLDDFLNGEIGDDDADDFLGGATEEDTPVRRGRKPSAAAQGKVAVATLLAVLSKPVSITFLAHIWNMDKTTIKKRLVDLPPIDQHRGQQPLYDFRQASQYLVNPRVNMVDFVKRMGVKDLPRDLQKDVWDARLKEQTWRERAGELWATSSVLEVLSDTFQRLKTTTQLWVDRIADDHALSAEARKDLMKCVDNLQKDMHRSLVEMPQEQATPSQEAELEEQVE
jgi:hypothetical protein